MVDLTGLTREEVKTRVKEGKVNITGNENKGKTTKEIVLSNLLTFFNLLNIAFFVLILLVGSYKNSLFFLVTLINTAIGIFQEIRTQKKLSELRILTAERATVIRDGREKSVPVTGIVLDDLLVLQNGDQIPADSVVVNGEIECNESLLTGESNNVLKKQDAVLYSGAFVTGGKCIAKTIHVGKENYAETISGEARKSKKVRSVLRDSMNRILKAVNWFIVPLCAGLFIKLYFVNQVGFRKAIEDLVSSGVGMIPEGLILLTSTALTLGVLRLAKQKTLVQELYCIETLARVSVICLDKTGTLTEGKVKVEDTVALTTMDEMVAGFQQILSGQDSGNATSEGLLDFFGTAENPWPVKGRIPFSSERKYSGVSFQGHGTYYMGAVQNLFPNDRKLLTEVKPYAANGLRVIVIAKTDMDMISQTLPANLVPLGYVTMSDVIRKDCEKTLKYFIRQGVELRVISGDDPLTVSMIAEKCGLPEAELFIDASVLHDDEMKDAVQKYKVFGRVKPEQKKKIVAALQELGHTVAMTGDGVNDVLAMKQADCSIAMAEGSDAAKHTANIVFLNSDFSSMPSVLDEGRRVINNISNASAMYLVKTTFSILLTLATIFVGYQYPFQAVQLTVISACAVGLPTFLLQLEPNFQPIGKKFMSQVFRFAVPSGITISIVCFLITNVGLRINPETTVMMQTICVICIGWIYFQALKKVYAPLSSYRRIVIYVMEIVCLLAMILFQNVLDLSAGISTSGALILIAVIAITPMITDLFEAGYDRFTSWREKRGTVKNRNKKGARKSAE